MAWLLLLPLDRLLVSSSLPFLINGIIKFSWNLSSSDMKSVSCAGGCNVDDRIYPYYIADPTSCAPLRSPGVHYLTYPLPAPPTNALGSTGLAFSAGSGAACTMHRFLRIQKSPGYRTEMKDQLIRQLAADNHFARPICCM